MSKKEDVYKDDLTYCKRIYGDHYVPLSLWAFEEVWRVQFPHCLLRPFCSVIGKCEVCARIDKLRRKATEESDLRIQEACQDAHDLHRGGMFMLERSQYKMRVAHCLQVLVHLFYTCENYFILTFILF